MSKLCKSHCKHWLPCDVNQVNGKCNFSTCQKIFKLNNSVACFHGRYPDSKLLIFSLFSITLQILIICTSLIWYGTIVFKRTPFHEWIVQNLEFRKCSLKIYCLSHNFGMLSPNTICLLYALQVNNYRLTEVHSVVIELNGGKSRKNTEQIEPFLWLLARVDYKLGIIDKFKEAKKTLRNQWLFFNSKL